MAPGTAAAYRSNQPWARAGTTIRLDLKVIPNAKADMAAGLAADADCRSRLERLAEEKK